MGLAIDGSYLPVLTRGAIACPIETLADDNDDICSDSGLPTGAIRQS